MAVFQVSHDSIVVYGYQPMSQLIHGKSHARLRDLFTGRRGGCDFPYVILVIYVLEIVAGSEM